MCSADDGPGMRARRIVRVEERVESTESTRVVPARVAPCLHRASSTLFTANPQPDNHLLPRGSKAGWAVVTEASTRFGHLRSSCLTPSLTEKNQISSIRPLYRAHEDCATFELNA